MELLIQCRKYGFLYEQKGFHLHWALISRVLAEFTPVVTILLLLNFYALYLLCFIPFYVLRNIFVSLSHTHSSDLAGEQRFENRIIIGRTGNKTRCYKTKHKKVKEATKTSFCVAHLHSPFHGQCFDASSKERDFSVADTIFRFWNVTSAQSDS